MTSNRKRHLLSLGIVFGALTGAVATYFLAPQKGNDTQKMLARKLNKFSQKSITKTQDLLINMEVALEKDMEENQDYHSFK